MVASGLLVFVPVLQVPLPPTPFSPLLLCPLFLPGRPSSPIPWGLLGPTSCFGILSQAQRCC